MQATNLEALFRIGCKSLGSNFSDSVGGVSDYNVSVVFEEVK